MSEPSDASLRWTAASAWVLVAVLSFQLALRVPSCSGFVVVTAGALFASRRVASTRLAFYLGGVTGLGFFVPHTLFLVTIFGLAAVPLWLILALWPALFLACLRQVQCTWGTARAFLLAPVLWTGWEFCRSEVYWLRFSWLVLGTPLDVAPELLRGLGVYGCGSVVMAVGAGLMAAYETWRRHSLRRAVPFLGASGLICLLATAAGLRSQPERAETVAVAGVQLEFPGEPEVFAALERLRRTHPEAQLVVLSEYTFDSLPPVKIRAWCREQGRWLIAGGRDPAGPVETTPGTVKPEPVLEPAGFDARSAPFRNTAFVVSTNGDIAFRQAKAVPIQFFQDGLPAQRQDLWNSPWGRIGLAICYDLNYRRVLDRLVEMGAQALIIPTMDVESWGPEQHEFHARMGRIRAAEYGLPIFRLASSGISQCLEAGGREQARAPFPGSGEILAGTLELRQRGTLPWDRFWLWPCFGGTLATVAFLFYAARVRRRAGQRIHSPNATSRAITGTEPF